MIPDGETEVRRSEATVFPIGCSESRLHMVHILIRAVSRAFRQSLYNLTTSSAIDLFRRGDTSIAFRL